MADRPSVILTAGYERSPVARALLQMLPNRGVAVVGVIMIRSMQARRIGEVLRQGGISALTAGVGKALGRSSPSSEPGPVEAYFSAGGLAPGKLGGLARERGIDLLRTDRLDSDEAIALVRGKAPDGLVYCGGGIVRQPLIDASAGRILNAHAGPLPQVRGMNAVEWSIWRGLPPCVTVHYIDRGIDTGPSTGIVRPIAVEPGDSIATLREKSLVESIEGLANAAVNLRAPVPPRDSDASAHAQYFRMHPLLQPELGRRIAKMATQ